MHKDVRIEWWMLNSSSHRSSKYVCRFKVFGKQLGNKIIILSVALFLYQCNAMIFGHWPEDFMILLGIISDLVGLVAWRVSFHSSFWYFLKVRLISLYFVTKKYDLFSPSHLTFYSRDVQSKICPLRRWS